MAGLFTVRVVPNFQAHVLDLGDRAEVAAALSDLEGGRDSSLFGGDDARSWEIQVPALGLSVSGGTETLEDLAEAAQILSSSGLSGAEQAEVWRAVVAEPLMEGDSYASLADDLTNELQGEDESEDNPRARCLQWV